MEQTRNTSMCLLNLQTKGRRGVSAHLLEPRRPTAPVPGSRPEPVSGGAGLVFGEDDHHATERRDRP